MPDTSAFNIATVDTLTLLLHNQHALGAAIEEIIHWISGTGAETVADYAVAAVETLDRNAQRSCGYGSVREILKKTSCFWQIPGLHQPSFPMKQTHFADADDEYTGKRKQTCKELFLIENGSGGAVERLDQTDRAVLPEG